MSAKIVGLTIQRGGNEPAEAVSEMKLLENSGIEGNVHQGGEKQVCLFASEARAWMKAQAVAGLCFKRFQENILTEGLSAVELTPGTQLSAGGALLRVSIQGKPCFDECERYASKLPCFLSTGAVFAVVEKSGVIHGGDEISIRR